MVRRYAKIVLVVLVGMSAGACSDDDSGSGGTGGNGGAGGGSLACRFDATVDGAFSVRVDGAAAWERTGDGGLLVTLRSRDWINDGSEPVLIDAQTGSLEELAPGSYPIVAGLAERTGTDAWSARYIEGEPGFDCPSG